jgi:hypothetical protein
MNRPTLSLRARRGVSILAAGTALLAGLAACGSSSSSADAKASTTTTSDPQAAGQDVHGKRYCEVLLVTLANGSGTGDVYNSFPMNACPQAQWSALDAGTIAKDNGVPLAVLNGPRYWLMDTIRNYGPPDTVQKTFGGIEMTKRATVDIGPVATARVPYTAHDVNRSVVFTFRAGTTIYELTAADGTTYVMQTWSQQVDPKLDESGLAALGTRLALPAGWKYSSRVLDRPLAVDTRSEPAHVFMDELGNSYSKLTSP